MIIIIVERISPKGRSFTNYKDKKLAPEGA